MDSKMDSGFLKPGETLEDDYDVLRPLEPAEVLGIIDGLLSSEVVASNLGVALLLMPSRLRGIWVTLCPKRCSPVYISTNSCGRSQNVAKMLALLATQMSTVGGTRTYIWSCGLIAWA